MCQTSGMGRMAWLLVAVLVLLIVTTVRIHYLPGRFGDHVTFEFVAPWR
jgi:hypothetical protein